MGSIGAKLAGLDLGLCLKDPDLQIKALETLAETFNPDMLLPIMDLTLEVEALGLAIISPPDEAPSLADHPVKTRDELSRLKAPEPASSGRMPLSLEVADRMRGIYTGMTGFYVIGPFTLAGELAGAEDFAISTISDSDFTERLIDFSCQALDKYVRSLAQRVDFITILEPSAMMLSTDSFIRFIKPALTRVIEVIEVGGASPVLHICGDTAHLFDEMSACGAEGYSLDALADMREAAGRFKPDQVLLGNIHPVEVMLEGEPDEVREACRNLLSNMEAIPSFVLASGCDLPADTPRENIAGMIQAVKNN